MLNGASLAQICPLLLPYMDSVSDIFWCECITAASMGICVGIVAGSSAWTLGSGETRWNHQKIGAEPDLAAFHI